MSYKYLLFVLLLYAFSENIYAEDSIKVQLDTIILKDNTILKGKIIKKEFGVVSIVITDSLKNKNITYTLQDYEIKSIRAQRFEGQTMPMSLDVYKKDNKLDMNYLLDSKTSLLLNAELRQELQDKRKPVGKPETITRTFWFRKIYGYRGFFDVGYTLGTGRVTNDRLEFSTSQGFQFDPLYYLGFGAGYSISLNNKPNSLPVFLNFRINFSDSYVTLFLDLKGGYSPIEAKGFYFSSIFGVSISKNDNFSLNIGAGYSLQNAAYRGEGINENRVKEKYNGLTFRLSFEY